MSNEHVLSEHSPDFVVWEAAKSSQYPKTNTKYNAFLIFCLSYTKAVYRCTLTQTQSTCLVTMWLITITNTDQRKRFHRRTEVWSSEFNHGIMQGRYLSMWKTFEALVIFLRNLVGGGGSLFWRQCQFNRLIKGAGKTIFCKDVPITLRIWQANVDNNRFF